MNIALLLVDVQEDFLSHPKLLQEKSALINNISSLLQTARKNSWNIFHVQTLIDADAKNAMPHWKKNGAKCYEGTVGATAPKELAPKDGEPIISKQFYSGFENTKLSAALNSQEIDTVVICGIHTHACVRATALDAYARGFKVIIAKEAVASYDKEHAEMTLQWIDNKAAECINTEDIVAKLSLKKEAKIWLQRNPADWNEIFSEVPVQGKDEIAQVIDKLNASVQKIKILTMEQKKQMLIKWHQYLLLNRQVWIDLLVKEMAKPIKDARSEVDYGLGLVQYACENGYDEEALSNGIVRYKPHGIVGLLTPWNNPFAIAIGKITPALIYGNCIIWKPALSAYGISKKIYESLSECGLDEFVGLIFGDAATGKIILNNKNIKAISFTGSVKVGKELAQVCGTFPKPLQAEMGGNNAAIILADMANEKVAKELVGAMFSFSGQRCTAIRRVIVEESVIEEFTNLLCREVQKLKSGDPSEEETQIGPLNSKEQQTYLLKMIDEAKENGAQIAIGGKIPSENTLSDGCWLEPTIITEVSVESFIYQNELFGPVVVIVKAKDIYEAIALHNNVEHGLLGALFTSSKKAQKLFLDEAQAGIISINQARPQFSVSGPFNGWKASGFGTAEHGRWNMDFYTQVQTIYTYNPA
ncbi:aldehyde dehydrogenase family protein [bacterium]|nr:aldehyde dehydrogenase family protein [bacterium]MBU1435226.1 aldehyde dehydrogenase family protein [bacterium]MBU1502919.1 aldehyde dehydrogenase family protein [bacterium]